MTDDVQRSLGRIEGAVLALQESLERVEASLTSHTAQDKESFDALSESIRKIRGSRITAAKWAAGVSTVVTAVAAAAKAYWSN